MIDNELKRARQKRYRDANRPKLKAAFKRWDKANRSNRRDYWREKRATDLNFRIARQLRIRLWGALQSGRGGSAVRDLGCSIPEFRSFIEKKFLTGMSWANWGEWHLDHIKPLASFDLAKRAQFLIAAHFSNYQPLWAADNIKKGSKI